MTTSRQASWAPKRHSSTRSAGFAEYAHGHAASVSERGPDYGRAPIVIGGATARVLSRASGRVLPLALPDHLKSGDSRMTFVVDSGQPFADRTTALIRGVC